MNVADWLTFSRILLVPPFVYAVYLAGPVRQPPAQMSGATWAAVGIFAVASLTDTLDGYVARRRNLVSGFGQYWDPLADKILVGAAMAALIVFRAFPLWAGILIVLREVLVSLLRSAASKRGRSMPAGIPGKVKTTAQIPMILVWLFPRQGSVALVQDAAVYLAVFLTLYSGLRYLARSSDLLAPVAGPDTAK